LKRIYAFPRSYLIAMPRENPEARQAHPTPKSFQRVRYHARVVLVLVLVLVIVLVIEAPARTCAGYATPAPGLASATAIAICVDLCHNSSGVGVIRGWEGSRMDDKSPQGGRQSAGRRRADAVLDRRHQELGRFVTASLILAASLELTGRLLAYGPGVSYNVSRIFTLFALLVFGGSTWYVLRQVYNIPKLSAAVLLGTGLVVFSQSYGVVSSLPFFAVPMGSWRDMLHGLMEEGTFVAGIAFLIGSFYVSIIETEKAKAHLAAEREDFIREVAERKRAEDSLSQAFAGVEQRVTERTASITETNQRLETEIAERQRVEQALRESEQLYRIVAEDAYDGICIVQDGEIVSMNTELCAILGYPTDEMLLHRPFHEVLHPETAEEALRMFEAFTHGMNCPALT